MIFSIPLNWIIAKLNVKYEKGIVTAKDKRTSVVNELISSVSAETVNPELMLTPSLRSSLLSLEERKRGG